MSTPPAGACQGRKQTIPLTGHTHLHPVHMDQARGKKGGLGPPKTQPTVHGP